jgi:hypothetical protein
LPLTPPRPSQLVRPAGVLEREALSDEGSNLPLREQVEEYSKVGPKPARAPVSELRDLVDRDALAVWHDRLKTGVVSA